MQAATSSHQIQPPQQHTFHNFYLNAKSRIQSEATKFLEIRVILSKLERQGLINPMLNLSYDIISAAVQQIRKQLSKVKTVSFEQERQALENIYKQNIKLIFSLTLQQVWNNLDQHNKVQRGQHSYFHNNHLNQHRQCDSQVRRVNLFQSGKYSVSNKTLTTQQQTGTSPNLRTRMSQQDQEFQQYYLQPNEQVIMQRVNHERPSTGFQTLFNQPSSSSTSPQRQFVNKKREQFLNLSPSQGYQPSTTKLNQFSQAINKNIRASGGKINPHRQNLIKQKKIVQAELQASIQNRVQKRDNSELGRRPAPQPPTQNDNLKINTSRSKNFSNRNYTNHYAAKLKHQRRSSQKDFDRLPSSYFSIHSVKKQKNNTQYDDDGYDSQSQTRRQKHNFRPNQHQQKPFERLQKNKPASIATLVVPDEQNPSIRKSHPYLDGNIYQNHSLQHEPSDGLIIQQQQDTPMMHKLESNQSPTPQFQEQKSQSNQGADKITIQNHLVLNLDQQKQPSLQKSKSSTLLQNRLNRHIKTNSRIIISNNHNKSRQQPHQQALSKQSTQMSQSRSICGPISQEINQIMDQSEFNYPKGAGTFGKQKRTFLIHTDGTESPGPADYDALKSKRDHSPGGVITQQRRKTQINSIKQQEFYPGPSDYNPKYHFVAK